MHRSPRRAGPDRLTGGHTGGYTLGYTGGYTLAMAKVMVSLPDDLLAQIDEEAERRSASRSALLAAAARRELSRPDSGQVAAAIARSEERFRAAGSFDAADLVRADRDARP